VVWRPLFLQGQIVEVHSDQGLLAVQLDDGRPLVFVREHDQAPLVPLPGDPVALLERDHRHRRQNTQSSTPRNFSAKLLTSSSVTSSMRKTSTVWFGKCVKPRSHCSQ